MNKIKKDKIKKRIPVPQKPPKVETNNKKYSRKTNKKIEKQSLAEE